MSENSDQRSSALWLWFVELCQLHALGVPQGSIQAVSGDASFRRYFRGCTELGTWILVDAPVDKEDSKPFIEVQGLLQDAGVQVPAIKAYDLAKGFMCLEDLGDQMLLSKLEAVALGSQRDEAVQTLYTLAFNELLKIQCCDASPAQLPVYQSSKLLIEMLLFSDWLCKHFLALELEPEEEHLLASVHNLLVDSANTQAQVVVHRDYHSRNLMVTSTGLGVIDFQDAVLGPFTYDLVSLLKDCYIKWPAAEQKSLALQYLHTARDKGIVKDLSDEQFLQDFALMGVQRHLKAAGIFCRLYLRDGKQDYLKDIPRTLSYICETTYQQMELNDFVAWLKSRVLPRLTEKLLSIEK